MKTQTSSRRRDDHKIRFNVLVRAETFKNLQKEIPSGSRSGQIEDWIEQGLRTLKHQRAVKNIERLREASRMMPMDDPRSTTEILREDRSRL